MCDNSSSSSISTSADSEDVTQLKQIHPAKLKRSFLSLLLPSFIDDLSVIYKELMQWYICRLHGSAGPCSFRLKFSFSVNMITHEPLHSAWWNFAGTRTSTTSRTLLNVKVVTWFLVFFCVPDAAATRGQYLALSKAWWSCCYLFCTESYFVLFIIFTHAICENQNWPRTIRTLFTRAPARSTHPSTLRGMVNWVSAFVCWVVINGDGECSHYSCL